MIILRFDTGDEERRALGWLAGRFSFKTWDNGDLMVHEAVLPYLAREGISFRVQGQSNSGSECRADSGKYRSG